jgi:hypothetical protein
MAFAPSGQEALALLGKAAFEVVVSRHRDAEDGRSAAAEDDWRATGGEPAAYTEIEEKCLTALGGTEGLEK